MLFAAENRVVCVCFLLLFHTTLKLDMSLSLLLIQCLFRTWAVMVLKNLVATVAVGIICLLTPLQVMYSHFKFQIYLLCRKFGRHALIDFNIIA